MAGWGVELLSIAISGVPFKPGMITPSFYASVVVGMIILGLMGMAIGVVVWLRIRDEVGLLTVQDALAEICVLLAQGRVEGVQLSDKRMNHGEAMEEMEEEEERICGGRMRRSIRGGVKSRRALLRRLLRRVTRLNGIRLS